MRFPYHLNILLYPHLLEMKTDLCNICTLHLKLSVQMFSTLLLVKNRNVKIHHFCVVFRLHKIREKHQRKLHRYIFAFDHLMYLIIYLIYNIFNIFLYILHICIEVYIYPKGEINQIKVQPGNDLLELITSD